MDDRQLQTSVIKTSTAEIYDKTSKILAAIEQCGCAHCLSILKSGLGNEPNHATDAENTKPVTKRFGYV